jgi:DDE superfamily endonuclease
VRPILRGKESNTSTKVDKCFWPHQALVPTFERLPATPLNRDQKAFNKQANKLRDSVEPAFGLLKGRWQCLNGLRLDPKDLLGAIRVEIAIKAAIVLHNLLRQWRNFEEDDPASFLTPEELVEYRVWWDNRLEEAETDDVVVQFLSGERDGHQLRERAVLQAARFQSRVRPSRTR